jgi:hypothetical protein
VAGRAHTSMGASRRSREALRRASFRGMRCRNRVCRAKIGAHSSRYWMRADGQRERPSSASFDPILKIRISLFLQKPLSTACRQRSSNLTRGWRRERRTDVQAPKRRSNGAGSSVCARSGLEGPARHLAPNGDTVGGAGVPPSDGRDARTTPALDRSVSRARASLVSIPCNRGTRLATIGLSPNIVVTIAALGDPCLQS